jgi:hypothetical protein
VNRCPDCDHVFSTNKSFVCSHPYCHCTYIDHHPDLIPSIYPLIDRVLSAYANSSDISNFELLDAIEDLRDARHWEKI